MNELHPHQIGFFYGVDNEDEIDFVGEILEYFNGYYLVAPILREHDALIIPHEYRAEVVL
jgi:hypothetical protein